MYKCFSSSGGEWKCKTVFRSKVNLTGPVEVNSLTSAEMVLTSSDSWEASSYSLDSYFRDLGNIKTIFKDLKSFTLSELGHVGVLCYYFIYICNFY